MTFFLAATVLNTHAAKETFERNKPHCNVSSGGSSSSSSDEDGFVFSANATASNGRASGTLEFVFDDGGTATYDAVAGLVAEGEDEPYIVLVFAHSLASSPNEQASDVLMATVRQSATNSNNVQWVFLGEGRFRSGTSLEAPGTIERVRGRRGVQGTSPRASSEFPWQIAWILESNSSLGIQADIDIKKDHRAKGQVEILLPDHRQPVGYDVLLGLPSPDPVAGLLWLILVVEGEPVDPANLILATVEADSSTDDDYDWDLRWVGDENNLLQFKAAGSVHVGKR